MASPEIISIGEERTGTATDAECSEQQERRPARSIHRQMIGLFAANILTILTIGFSFVAYSKLLSPPEFGLYAVALSAATLLALILDGGLKTTIIKSETSLLRDEESSIALLMVIVSIALILILVAVQQPLLALRPQIKHDSKFVVVFVGIALLFYPFVTLPTAKLERELKYGHIAWIESLGTIVERGGPALFLLFTKSGIYSFIWALLISRVLRATILATFHPVSLSAASWVGLSNSWRHLREGAWIQAGTVSSVIRDNLHTLLVGPFFGKEWIGYYAWAFQICLVSSQVFAQISARVSLPLLAQAKSFQERWSRCLYQVRLLALLTVPMLCGVWLVLPIMNSRFFQGKWQPALAIVPLLFLRMVPGIATTPIGPLIMVQRGGRSFAKVSILWTLAEIVGASFLLFALGPTGLAWSCAVMVWVGLWFMLVALGQNSLDLGKQLTARLLRHPSFVFLVPATLLLGAFGRSRLAQEVNPVLPVIVAFFLVAGSVLLEPDFRKLLAHEKR